MNEKIRQPMLEIALEKLEQAESDRDLATKAYQELLEAGKAWEGIQHVCRCGRCVGCQLSQLIQHDTESVIDKSSTTEPESA